MASAARALRGRGSDRGRWQQWHFSPRDAKLHQGSAEREPGSGRSAGGTAAQSWDGNHGENRLKILPRHKGTNQERVWDPGWVLLNLHLLTPFKCLFFKHTEGCSFPWESKGDFQANHECWSCPSPGLGGTIPFLLGATADFSFRFTSTGSIPKTTIPRARQAPKRSLK